MASLETPSPNLSPQLCVSKRRGRGCSGQQPLAPAQHQFRGSVLNKYLCPRHLYPQEPIPMPSTSHTRATRCVTQPVPPYLIHPGLLYTGAQVLHAAVDVPLGLQLGFHAWQVCPPLCPLQSHLKQAKRSKSALLICRSISQKDTRASKPPRSLKMEQTPHQFW